MKIVYCSKTGHTEKYAKMLSKALNIECISIEKYKGKDDIIFIGWVNAGKLMGYKDITNKICTIAVGLANETVQNSNSIIKSNKINEKFFYLQGGIDYTKLKGIMKFMFKIAGKLMKKYGKANKELYDIYINGGNFVKEENLKDIIKYINKEKKL